MKIAEIPFQEGDKDKIAEIPFQEGGEDENSRNLLSGGR